MKKKSKTTTRIVTFRIKENNQFDYEDVNYREKSQVKYNISIKDINKYVLKAFSEDNDYRYQHEYAILKEKDCCSFFLDDKRYQNRGTEINFQFENKETGHQFKNENYEFNSITQQLYSAINTAKYYLNLINSGAPDERPYEETLTISKNEKKIAKAYLDFREFDCDKTFLILLIFSFGVSVGLLPIEFMISNLIFHLIRGSLFCGFIYYFVYEFGNYHIYSYDFLKKSRDFLCNFLHGKKEDSPVLELRENIHLLEENKEAKDRDRGMDTVFLEISRLVSKIKIAQNSGLDCSHFAKILNDILDEYDRKRRNLKEGFGSHEYFISFQYEALTKLDDLESQFDLEFQKYEREKNYLQDLQEVSSQIDDLREDNRKGKSLCRKI